MGATRSAQGGVALLLVLWASTLLAILLGGYALQARTEGLQARYQFAQTQAHYAAEAGLMRAVYGLQDPRPGQRWIGDDETPAALERGRRSFYRRVGPTALPPEIMELRREGHEALYNLDSATATEIILQTEKALGAT